MKILVLTQVFYPDTVSVSQHLTDFAVYMSKQGHDVNVLTSSYAYDENRSRFKKHQVFNGIQIRRVNQTRFGKKNQISRLVDFASFYLSIFLKLLFQKKNHDLILVTSVPPMLSVLGILVAKVKRIPLYYWLMDLQPELSISSGLLTEGSFISKTLLRLSNYSIKHSKRTIALDRFMKAYLEQRGIKPETIVVHPVWPVMSKIYEGDRLNNPFRIENDFGDKIVVMYSGNHSYVHPLDTLLEASLALRGDDRFLFAFVGGGVRKKDVSSFREKHNLSNIIQLPFQPRENIHNSLGSSDIQVVIMGDGQVGYTHPNKIYGALFIGKPIIYIGPKPSHVEDILENLKGNITVEHGQSDELVEKLLEVVSSKESIHEIGNNNKEYAQTHFSPGTLMSQQYESLFTDNNCIT
ncbi:glycosyltransferase family 4 protein [Marinoscillum furvescens]|uniref:Glycosyltransferase involved in cell wall biosynthesis n=1 Tax=Marinoscillum furvescens DSM 4134 TaxID=1122208 RepID=A0A3D9L067_MARFU|nr:glycosyltransferase family 4 protein [Marinoscillum furvescens]RED96144.1 glycosyltransferase involved in cell wall biosynthesis [Marinoscillum furvescens DSM 4134]